MPRIFHAVLMAAAAAFPAHAADWGQLATISSTLGVNANRLCVGEGLRSDIGCPTYAPYLDANGSVGIGRQPSYFFDVSSSVTYALQIAGPNALYMDITNGTGKMRSQVVNSNGYLGMMNAGALAFNTSGIERVHITANGNVGISTSNPNAKLEVNGDISATNLRLSGNLYVSGSQTFDGVTFANGGVSATGTITATSFSGDGSRLTGLASGDRITSGTSSIIVSNSGHISFTTAGTERMVINSSGNVGIGTRAPIAPLHVVNSAATVGLIVSTSTDYNGIRQASDAFMYYHGANKYWQFYNPGGDWRIGNAYDTSKHIKLLANAASNTYALIEAGTAYTSGLYIKTGVAYHMVIGADGKVGIGTTSPQATLQVSGSFTVSTSAQTTTPSLYVGTNGNMGVGTSSPSAPLEVQSNSGNTEGVRIARNGVPTQYLSLHEGGAAAHTIEGYGQKGIKIINRSSTGDHYAAIGFFVSTSTLAMEIAPNGKVGIGTTLMNDGIGRPSSTLHVSGTARITSWTAIAANVTPTTELDVYGTISATNILVNGAPITGTADRITSGTSNIIANTNGPISFTTAGIERMVINSAGNVGIGTTNPSSPLEISGTTAILTLEDGSGIYGGSIRFKNSGTTKWTLGGGMDGADIDSFGLSNSSGVEKLHLTQAGNVGIGTISPGKTLSVSGTAEFVSRTLVGGTGTPSATLQVSGSLLLAGNDNIPCTASVLGLVRRNPTTGRLQACR